MSAADLSAAKKEAVAWFTRQRGGLTAEESRELDAWLDADATHTDAFEAVARAWARLELPREAPEMLGLRAKALEVVPQRRMVWRMAAGIAAAAALGGGLYGWDTLRFKEYPDQTFRTEVGQRSTVTLPDGSVVTLNTDTVLRTRADGERRVLYLDRGQAYFKVAKDRSHPFEVHAAGRTVTALGTAFDVRVERGKFAVTLVEGKVRVETPSPKAPSARASAVQDVELVAGNQFTALDETRWSVGRADTARETAWRTGWLTFQNQPLGEVVAEFARYSDRQIVLDPELADRPITGRFKAGDIDAFVEALAAYDVARLETDREVVRLSTPASSS